MEHLEQRQKVTIMVAIMAAMLFAAINQTIVGTALPLIVADIGGMDYFNWVFTVFMLTASVTSVLVGKLSDMFGRKPFILIGISIFMVGTFLCGTSTHIFQLIGYRAVQGFGGGMIMSTSFTAVGDLFPPRERGRWQGMLGAVFGLASVFGPTLGGYIAEQWRWNWVFWMFLPIGVVAFGLIWKLFPRQTGTVRKDIDYKGAILLVCIIIPLLLGFSWGGTVHAWGSPQVIGLFSTVGLALVLFIWNERRAKEPVLPLGLFKSDIFTLSNAIGFLMGMGMFGAVMYMPFFIQGVIGLSASKTGFVMMSMMLSMVLTSTIGGQWITRSGKYKWIAMAGLMIMALGMFSMSQMDPETTVTVAVLNLVAVGLGLGLSFPVFTLTVQNAVEHRYLGVATASSQLFRQLGGTIGVAVMGAIMNRVMSSSEPALPAAADASQASDAALYRLADPKVLMDHEAVEQIKHELSGKALLSFDELLEQMKEMLSSALDGAFGFGGIILLLAIALTLFLREIPLRVSNEAPSGKRG